jgi:hypothetical protein
MDSTRGHFVTKVEPDTPAELRRRPESFDVVCLNGGAIVYQRGRGTEYQGGGRELNRVYFENRSFSSSGLRVSLTQRRSAMT